MCGSNFYEADFSTPKIVENWIVDQSTAHNFTVGIIINEKFHPACLIDTSYLLGTWK